MIKVSDIYLKKAYNLIEKDNNILNICYKKKNKLNIKKKNKLNIQKKNRLNTNKYLKILYGNGWRPVDVYNKNDKKINTFKQELYYCYYDDFLFFQIKINFKNKNLNKKKKLNY
jgi:hypothetical protein